MVKESKTTIIAILMTLVVFLLPYALLTTNAPFQNILNEKFSYIKSEKMVRNVVFYLAGYAELDKDFFSEQALKHMKDVKSIVTIMKLITLVLMLGLFCLLFYLKNLDIKKTIKKSFRYFCYFAVFLIICSIFFSYTFETFHETVFSNDDWSFDDNDTIVNLYTETFFQAFFVLCSLLSFGSVTVIYLVSKNIEKFRIKIK